MKKIIPYRKLSKTAKKEINKKKRTTWGTINPVTRRGPNPRAYNRKKLPKNADL